MPRKNSKYDVVQYCMRLNLNNPEHLEVHKIMQNLNRENYKSQTAFMAQAILETFSRYSEEEILSDAAAERKKKEKYITRGEFEEYKDESSKECEPFLASIAMNMDGSSKELDMHYEQLDKKNYPGEIVHNFNGHDYRILEQIKDKNFIVFDLNSGSFAVAIGLKNYNRYPKGENPTHENSMEAVSWEHGVYLPQYPSLIDFKLLKEKYGEEVKEEISEEKSFDIEIKEILSRVETVEAECLDDAIEKAMDMYYSEKIVLDSEDFKGVDFTRYTDETKKR